MQKTIVQNICDDCSKQVQKFALKVDNKDLCLSCLLRRVVYSATVLPVGSKCTMCKGTGHTKDPDGYNGIVKEECKRCLGSGQAQFDEIIRS